MFYDNLERINNFLGYKNSKFEKSKNWHFSKGNTNRKLKKSKNWHFSKRVSPWFWSKICQFSNFFYLGNIGQENVFYDILERKENFLGYKNRKFKKSKNWHFSKRVSPTFWSKIGHFSNFFLGDIGQENVFYDILEQKNNFLGYKNRKLKKSKNWHFSKWVSPWFWSKIGHI